MENEKLTWRIFNITLSRGLWVAIFIIPFLWLATLLLLFAGKDAGPFGDMFGAVNALFSGFAFIGIIISIRMQSEELELQRTELKETKEEFKNQNFQTTFFNLLRTQREITDEINLKIVRFNNQFKESYRIVNGKNFFRSCKLEIRKIIEALDSPIYQNFNINKIENQQEYLSINLTEESAAALFDYHEETSKLFTLHYYNINQIEFDKFKLLQENQVLEKLQFVYRYFFMKHGYAVGHYFRHIYHILRFLEKSENRQIEALKMEGVNTLQPQIEEIKEEHLSFVEFLKSSLDTPELFTLLYNSYNYPKAQKLLIKYRILDTLHEQDLIDVRHNLIPEYNLIVNS